MGDNNRILVIGVDKDIHESIKMEFISLNYENSCVVYGKEGLKKIKESRFDCIILDEKLVDVDGNDLCQTIRLEDQKTPILYISYHKDEDKKIIVEVKGRTTAHDKYDDTIITAGKVTSGFQAIEQGYKVYFVFAFSDKTMYIELKSDASFQCRFTGTNCVKHYMIPVKDLIDLPTETEDPEPE